MGAGRREEKVAGRAASPVLERDQSNTRMGSSWWPEVMPSPRRLFTGHVLPLAKLCSLFPSFFLLSDSDTRLSPNGTHTSALSRPLSPQTLSDF
jgi:hypothetical protein